MYRAHVDDRSSPALESPSDHTRRIGMASDIERLLLGGISSDIARRYALGMTRILRLHVLPSSLGREERSIKMYGHLDHMW